MTDPDDLQALRQLIALCRKTTPPPHSSDSEALIELRDLLVLAELCVLRVLEDSDAED